MECYYSRFFLALRYVRTQPPSKYADCGDTKKLFLRDRLFLRSTILNRVEKSSVALHTISDWAQSLLHKYSVFYASFILYDFFFLQKTYFLFLGNTCDNLDLSFSLIMKDLCVY